MGDKSHEQERAERAAKASGRTQRYGVRLQNRFDFYAVALAFTLLGLSVQTARFGQGHWADCLELLGWVALLISALAGLWRLEKSPGYFMKAAEYLDYSTLPGNRATVAKEMGELDLKIKRSYVLQKYAFLAGLILVSLARGLPPAADLCGYVLL